MTTFTFAPATTFEVIDAFPFDGQGDTNEVFPGNFDTVVLGSSGENSENAEFDISGFSLPSQEIISSVKFQVEISSTQVGGLGVSGENPTLLGVAGYIGNGLPDAADFQAGSLIDAVDISSLFVGEVLTFDITDFVKNLVSNGDSFVGLAVRALDFGGLALSRNPKLTITTTISDNTHSGGTGDDTLFGCAGKLEDQVFPRSHTINAIGNSHNNTVTSNSDANVLAGHDGNDQLLGRAGKHTLDGRNGNGRLDGGAGNDSLIAGVGAGVLTGGDGRDSFFLHVPNYNSYNPDYPDYNQPSDGFDTIPDFSIADKKLVVSIAEFGVAQPLGVLNPDIFRLGSSATSASDRFIYDQSTGNLFFDPDGSGTASPVQIAKLSNQVALTNSNIVLIA